MPFRSTPPRRSAVTAGLATAWALVAVPLVAQTPAPPAAAKPAAAAPAAPAEAPPTSLVVETTDGIEVTAWYYAVPESTEPLGTVILLHDLGGSHRSVEPLARSLQAAGCAVVVPDLRGHGESRLKSLPLGQDDQSRLLKKSDFEMMAAARGGQLRDQSGVRGDVECVRNWIKKQADEGKLRMKPLVVVGSGLGAAVGATWSAADALWPDIATGPQGRDVAGIVMVSPTFTTKGYSIGPALAVDPVRRTIPILIIAGDGDRDAIKIFDQLKRQRPREWFDIRSPTVGEKDGSPVAAADASLMLLTSPLTKSADALAAHRSPDPKARAADPASLILGFMRVAATRRK
jgi:alpha-beta hydrolase superfamily lysophospholipase